MVIGGVLAGLVSVIVYFAAKALVSTQRDRLALSALWGGGVCISTSGFLVSAPLGYLAVGLISVFFSILLAYQSGE